MERLRGVGQRHAGSEGEREMLYRVKGLLPDGARGRIEGFVAFSSPSVVLGLHAFGLLAAGALGWWHPLWGAIACAALTASLFAESTGKFSVLRRFAPKSPSYNLVVPMEAPDPLGTVVLATALDAPTWRPDSPRWLKRPLKAVMGAAVVVTSLLTLAALAQPWGRPTSGMYFSALVVLGVTVVLQSVMQRRRGGVDDDVSGMAVQLELVRRFQEDLPPHTSVWAVFTGCGHAYQNGMAAFLAMHGRNMTEPVLVLALDDPGRPPLSGVISEGPLFAQHHRSTGPALLERLRWAGVDIPSTDRAGETEARAALLMGYRALALSGDEDAAPSPEVAERAVDVAEILVRWFDEDLARVAVDAPKLEGFAQRRLPGPGAEVDAEERSA